MTQAMVDSVVQALELGTPADPTRGLVAIDTDTFGDPPDVDGDPRIYLVYFDIKGYGAYSFDGFFRDSDQTQSSEFVNQTGARSAKGVFRRGTPGLEIEIRALRATARPRVDSKRHFFTTSQSPTSARCCP